MTMWGGRFGESMDPQAWALNASISFDQRLAPQDVRASLAWAGALGRAGVLLPDEADKIRAGLQAIATEIEAGNFAILDSDEDIHSAVERRLGELIGPLAGKLHTGRSRNDQVATDLRLWLMDGLPALNQALVGLQRTYLQRAEADLGIWMPGYTHLQRAQPLLLSHWWLSHFWPLQRDRDRLFDLAGRLSVLPLGSGALAGTAFPIQRDDLALELGFLEASHNSIDAVSDRDFVVEFSFVNALIGVHLSRLAEAMVLFTSSEFAFFELADAFATGSSLLPQKKNPDVFELARGKAGGLIGGLAGLLAMLKGLPSTYDKDLQEDKVPLFWTYDTLLALLPVLAGAIRTLTVRPESLQAAIDPAMLASDLADLLVSKGVPFRQAHLLVGKSVQRAGALSVSLAAMSPQEWQAIDKRFGSQVSWDELRAAFDPQVSIERRSAKGGTSTQAVKDQIQGAESLLDSTMKFEIR
jgi:argininosuccinate lyase